MQSTDVNPRFIQRPSQPHHYDKFMNKINLRSKKIYQVMSKVNWHFVFIYQNVV